MRLQTKRVNVRDIPNVVSVSAGELTYQVMILVEDWEEDQPSSKNASYGSRRYSGRYSDHVPVNGLVSSFAKTRDVVHDQNSNGLTEDSCISSHDREASKCMDNHALSHVQASRDKEGYSGNATMSITNGRNGKRITNNAPPLMKLDLKTFNRAWKGKLGIPLES